MLPIDEALATLLEATPVLPFESVPLDVATGRILQEDVLADRDYPDFDKSLMDGFAVIASDLKRGLGPLLVLEEITAGDDPDRLREVTPGSASRIMTGAPVPPGADAVLMVEETATVPGQPERVLPKAPVEPGANLARRGADVRAGDLLLRAGTFLGPAETGVLASTGRTPVRVGGLPRLSVLSTGDELVEPDATPARGRIRNSNGPLLLALARRSGGVARSLGIAPDEPERLRALVTKGLEEDVLVLSGGVSMGSRDLVGETLRSLGVEILFERVAIKPGKPFTAGRRAGTIVLGCPGNPASTYVIFQFFGRAVLRRLMGAPDPAIRTVKGILAGPVRQRTGRAGYYQARATVTDGTLRVEIVPSTGSADFVSCARGNALAVIPSDVSEVAAGALVDVVLLDDRG